MPALQTQSLSKTAVDRAGNALSKGTVADELELQRHEDIFDEYRKAHLEPLTATTLQLQSWLTQFDGEYYVAQRLKRKPQIVRKLNRLSVRLSQLQDIGGARIVVRANSDVDRLHAYLVKSLQKQRVIDITRTTDYRQMGRDQTGYRALHLILKCDSRSIELQLRSEAQHYWSEQIERTSIIYGHHLKESEGHPLVIRYLKSFLIFFTNWNRGESLAAFKSSNTMVRVYGQKRSSKDLTSTTS